MVKTRDLIVAQEDKMHSKLSDVGAERAVLAGLFAYGVESYVEISDFLTHSSFAHQNNQVIYKCIEKILQSDAHVDVPAILSAAQQLNLSETIQTRQELEYINSLMEFPIKKLSLIHISEPTRPY